MSTNIVNVIVESRLSFLGALWSGLVVCVCVVFTGGVQGESRGCRPDPPQLPQERDEDVREGGTGVQVHRSV